MRSYRKGILWDVDPNADRMRLAVDLVHTLDTNIRHYLRDKSQTMTIDIETAKQAFPTFWERIGAEGDLEAALHEPRFQGADEGGTQTDDHGAVGYLAAKRLQGGARVGEGRQPKGEVAGQAWHRGKNPCLRIGHAPDVTPATSSRRRL